ncbi:MAG: hypothetical protein K0U12_06465 [Gammaproteobacteria bacterium]|nr:hypothetical protein [Gammaproteobacteria bacterium]
MSDDRKYTPSEDEYQFPQEEQVHYETGADSAADESAQPVQPRAGFNIAERFPNWRRLVLVAGIVVLAFIVFAFLHHSSPTTKIISKQPVVAKVISPSVPAENEVLAGHFNNVQQKLNSQQNAISGLQSQLSQLNNQASDSRQAELQIAKALQHLSFQMQQFNSTLNTRLSALTKTKHGIKQKVLPKPITYNVKAIVPGRAWLIGSNDTTTTVRRGDHLKNYGTITVINANAGKILTSSGKVIAYGPGDN